MQDYFGSGLDDAVIGGRVAVDEWKENFPMNRENFMKLAEELRPTIHGQATKNSWKLRIENVLK